MSNILFYGDPHREYAPLFEACAKRRPDHVIVLGYFELDCPFREKMAPLLSQGIKVWWILGNHDLHTDEMHDFLIEDYPEGNLGCRVVEMESEGQVYRVAGLGGVFRGRVWYPANGEPPKHRTREEFLAVRGKASRWRGGLPLRQRDTIFPEDIEKLSAMTCDILVTHEAPSCHQHGVEVLDDLAKTMGAKLLVHGHMHYSYESKTKDGIPVKGIDGKEVWWLPS